MVVELARLQFAVTAGLHFLFVILTLGLGPIVAVMETRYALTKKPVFEQMTRFWGQIYVINYAMGIIVGLALEFQFGLNWSGLSHFAGDVFGAPLAMETLVAFFIESTFLGIWIFGWGHLPRLVHVALFWIVVLAAYASVFWIMVANGFLQNPAGGERVGDHMVLSDIGALVTNESAISAIRHIVAVVLLAGGFFVAGVSAWHFRRKTEHHLLFRSSMRIGLLVAAVAGFFVVSTGYSQLDVVEQTQPLKFATVWTTGDTDLAQLQEQAVAEFGPGDYTPPDWIATAFQVMTWVGGLFEYLFWLPLLFLIKNWIERRRWLLWFFTWFIPVPFIAATAGWLVREAGRQPWLVYGELRVEDAISPVSTAAVLTSFVAFTLVFAVLAVIDYLLIARVARAGPDAAVLGAAAAAAPEPGDTTDDDLPLRL
ncbi:cytochrome BD oxidase subunit I [Actinomadura sp. CNU-125]|uniref:cytochrome ubiquinol oxidase subunit I n=1 Tax=Actinomadura sp. CNU-125 TaxID=1904961 RepID=UPI00095A4E8C|nr:cytochrome ubiquinol oxidase subunit I [Actinomadura sp. CNU-125]OLT20879.1 cytochrome BD oxidase subunit I [Actinomadura sp. CNU-125]